MYNRYFFLLGATLALTLIPASCGKDRPKPDFTVTFDSRGGSAVSSQTVAEGDTVVRPADPTREGYTFAGWSTDSATTMLYDFSTPVTADLTLYALWNINTFTITFAGRGGSAVSSQTVTQDSMASRPTAPTREGYVFAGWSTDSVTTMLYDFSTPVTADLTLYALWNINTFTITFAGRGGSAVSSQTVTQDSMASRPTDPTRAGYTFAGWSTDPATTMPYNFSTPVTGDLTLYARWISEGINTFTITFDSRGGNEVSSQTVAEDSTVFRPTNPTRQGYTFAGWSTDPATTMLYDFSTPVTGELVLYARWIAVFTITFDSRGGSAVSSRTVTQDSMVSRPTDPTREGYVFAGWSTDPATTMLYDFSTPVTGELTLYAGWISEQINTFTITFDSRGGNEVSSQTVAENNTVFRPTNLTRQGYTFEGWYTDSATTMLYDFSTSVTADLTLYARWREKLVAVPDASFRAALRGIVPDAFRGDSLNTAHNDVLSLDSLDVNNNNIASLEGIEYFTGLTNLACFSNRLDSLDVSKNTALTRLQCDNNNLTTLDVSANTALTFLECNRNLLDSLDVSKNTALELLSCSSNRLDSLDVSKNTALELLSCGSNRLTTLDVSVNTALRELYCHDNNLITLDLRGIRTVVVISINAGTGGNNPIARLLVHDNVKDQTNIRGAKAVRGNDLTIEVYTAAAGSTDYTQSCADYDPTRATDKCTTSP